MREKTTCELQSMIEANLVELRLLASRACHATNAFRLLRAENAAIRAELTRRGESHPTAEARARRSAARATRG